MPDFDSPPTVAVKVGGAIRRFPAHMAEPSSFGSFAARRVGAPRFVLTPDSVDGWEFRQTVSGEWHGFETGR